MKIEHIAIWTRHLEEMKDFYIRYFDAKSNDKYSSDKGERGVFESYFLSFDGGSRLELMRLSGIPQGDNARGARTTGLTHLAISVGTKEDVDSLVKRLRTDGHIIAGEPRTTGDGYYEACIPDPDGNRVEITAD